MEFNKAYNRQDFVYFLQNNFLPDDFIPALASVSFKTKMIYSKQVVKLGSSASLDLVVYEVIHKSKHDARVSLSKEAFRMLADETEDRALVVFIPEDNDDNYRFSLIEIELEAPIDSARITRSYSNPRRYSYLLGKGIAYYTPNKYLNEKGRVVSPEDLRSRFSVEVLTKSFYQELSDWYAWVVKIIRFPNKLNDPADDDKFNAESTIRLVTRLIFVWFLKQKNLIPNEFFDRNYIKDNLLEDFNPEYNPSLFYNAGESKYYKAILQNLFFAMLNSPITKEGETELSERHFRKNRGDYDNNKLMRYESLFTDPQLFVNLANRTVPFLNGGLFDCLDDKDADNYIDGFSDRKEVQESLFVPDYIFFAKEVIVDLSHWYEDKKKKKVKVSGILNILKRYNFTIEENTPFDQEVSLDPELLGNVFENLLASYNPETQTTARKQTGSFYTPREIVQYMVDESLVAHLKRIVGEDLEPEFRKLVAYTDEEPNLTDEQKHQIMEAIYNCKVLDPACGSGAFPVGMLQQMVHILNRIDPTNENWKNMLIDNAVKESRNAFQADTDEERNARLKDIEDSFNESLNNPDYARKLYLIENCIYGVDIQPIAIQISKLRFFISLVVDQLTNNDPIKNFGIRPLPNLEAKFVAANTLIPLTKNEGELGRTPAVIAIENRLKEANHKIFRAKSVKTKRRWKDRLKELRKELATQLANDGFLSADAANQLASWDMFDQNASASFFDAEWMFGVKDGFDIVIGNPPYIEFKNLSKDIKNLLKSYVSAKGKYDLYVPFIERAIYIACHLGIITFIIPTRFLIRDYGSSIRKIIHNKTKIISILDFADFQIFENATTYTGVFVYQKEECNNYEFIFKALRTSTSLRGCKNIFSATTSNDNIKIQKIDCRYLLNPVWNFNDSNVNKILLKMKENSIPLKDLCEGIYQGIASGKDEVFFISEDTIQEFSIERELLHPVLKGKDVSPYTISWSNLYVIYPYDENGKVLEENYLRNYCPNLYAYLRKCKEKLSGRGYFEKSTKKWFELWNQRKPNTFVRPKIVTLDNASCNSFAYDSDGYFTTTTVYSIILKSNSILSYKYLLGLLNSKLLFYYHRKNSIPQANGFYRYQAIFINKIPIKTSQNQEIVISLVEKIIKAKKDGIDSSILEKSLDIVVYHLYNLSYNEVLIVDPETPITREEYEK